MTTAPIPKGATVQVEVARHRTAPVGAWVAAITHVDGLDNRRWKPAAFWINFEYLVRYRAQRYLVVRADMRTLAITYTFPPGCSSTEALRILHMLEVMTT